MRVLRLTIPTILFTVFLVGCIVHADTYSDQSPFIIPDTLQDDDRYVPTPTPLFRTATPTPTPTATPSCESWHSDDECDRIQGRS